MSNMKTMFDLNQIDSQGVNMNMNTNQQTQVAAKNALESTSLGQLVKRM
jgi:hypothetical protein